MSTNNATSLESAVKGQKLNLKNAHGYQQTELVTVARVTKTRIFLVEDERVFLKVDGDVYGDQDDWSKVVIIEDVSMPIDKCIRELSTQGITNLLMDIVHVTLQGHEDRQMLDEILQLNLESGGIDEILIILELGAE